jgi:hypothetical protein
MIGYFRGARKNIRNGGGLCLDVAGGKNKNNQHLTFWPCHNGLNQAWFLDTRGIKYPLNPIRDGIKFQIKTRMAENRALFWHEAIAGGQFRLRIRNNNPANNKQWWIFSSRTHTVRAWADRRQVISNQDGQGYKIGVAAVVRPWKGVNFQGI